MSYLWINEIAEVVEVGPRDGFQSIKSIIPTDIKIRFVERLAAAGLRRIEIGSFVSSKALPQMQDTPELLTACDSIVDIFPQVLVPNCRRGEQAMKLGAKKLVFVISVSEAHNRANVNNSREGSVKEYAGLLKVIPKGTFIRLDIAASFDCPFDGRIPVASTVELVQQLVNIRSDVEICLCDTTGRADPLHVRTLFYECMKRFPIVPVWAFHPHDTYGLGLANAYAAFEQGVRVFDASLGGLGGCPFAPGATGNLATEDLVWMFQRLGVHTGIDLNALLAIAEDGANLPDAQAGGRVRSALRTHVPCSLI